MPDPVVYVEDSDIYHYTIIRKLLDYNLNVQLNQNQHARNIVEHKGHSFTRLHTQGMRYTQKQRNKEIYYIHIQNENALKSIWNNIEQSINQKLQDEMKIIHDKQQQKIRNLSKLQTNNTSAENNNYARVVNTTNVHFMQDEM
jgi:hypothetical protein